MLAASELCILLCIHVAFLIHKLNQRKLRETNFSLDFTLLTLFNLLLFMIGSHTDISNKVLAIDLFPCLQDVSFFKGRKLFFIRCQTDYIHI